MSFTISASATAEMKVLRSEFLAFLYPVESTGQIQELLKQHNLDFANATHNCYAWVLGLDQKQRYFSDAGEPGGTAGKPILNALLRHDLTNVLAMVTRYYGGIKLGVKGLIDAYGSACEAAIGMAELIPAVQYRAFRINCEYGQYEPLKHQILAVHGKVEETVYDSDVTLLAQVPDEESEAFRAILESLYHTGKLKYKEFV